MRAALLSIVLLLAGCGFQLQGRNVMPPKLATLHLQPADEQSDFTRALRRALTASGSRLVAAPAADGTTVRIVRDEFEERVVSVDARNVATDLELIYEVEVEVRDGVELLMAPEHFEVSRRMSDNVSKALAKEGEKDILRAELAKDMASVVARRLSKL